MTEHRADDLEAILAHAGDIERRLLVLDFDGTLSPIVDRPEDAALAPGVHEALETLTRRTAVVVLSGRPVAELVPRMGDLRLTMIGGHGAEIRRPDGEETALFDSERYGSTLDRVAERVSEIIDPDRGWQLERKHASLAIHHRRADDDEVEQLLPQLREVISDHANEKPGWELLDGKRVLEMRPLGVDKGEALRWAASRYPGRRPLVIGDDVTDEDAFRAARKLGGDGVLVAAEPRPTSARWRLDDTSRVVELLNQLLSQHPDAPSVELGGQESVRFHQIHEYGLIGDSRTAALVSPDASIDWMCAPRFDSPSLFAAILDPVRGGRFRVRPVAWRELQVQRTYLGETNVLVTRFVRDGNPILTVTDFLVYSRVNAFDATHTGHMLLRRLEAFEDLDVEIEFQPRFDYGRAHTYFDPTPNGVVARAGTDRAELIAPGIDLTLTDHEDGNGGVARSTFTLRPNSHRWLRLHTGGTERGPHNHLSEQELLDLTVRTWGRWASLIDYDGPWRDEVVRSALVLKGLVYEPTGALVAAPTMSLPEHLGGERNWDYRYAWIRDSAYVLETFLRVGHAREAETFIRWLSELTERIGGAHALRPLYRVTGDEDLTEFELPHLTGYRDSRPVRVGNGAASQLQLDIYGAAMQLGYLTEQLGGEIPAARWSIIVELVESVAQRWEEPDSGLWEIRSAPKHHTFSKFQCWLAVDRAIRIGQGLGLRGPYDRWRAVANRIHQSILENGFDKEQNAFTQAYGEAAADASILLLPLKGFLPARDHRIRGTVDAIRRELEVGDGLLLRYRTVDGLRGEEGAFLMCSFWLVEVLARMGDLDEAIRLFERLLSLAGPLGLFAEEIDPVTHDHLGNYPQGFTHMGLIGAATAIHEELQAQRNIVTDHQPHLKPI